MPFVDVLLPINIVAINIYSNYNFEIKHKLIFIKIKSIIKFKQSMPFIYPIIIIA